MDESTKNNFGVSNGILFAITVIGLGTLLYFVDKKLFLNPSLRFFASLIIPIFFMRKAALEQRESQGGLIKFSEAIQPAFLCLIIGSAAFTLFQFFLMKIDFNLLEIQREITVESMKEISKFMELPAENLEAFEEMTPEDLSPTLKSLVLGIAKNFIFGFAMAAITAVVIKRDK